MTIKTVFLLPVAFASVASAQIWVSAATGSDTNLCTRTAPCKTFQKAVNVAPVWSQVTVLDAGDYGPVTISQSVTIDGAGLATNVATSGSAIFVQAGSGIVQLRNLSIHGNGAQYGINLQNAGQMVIENVKVNGFGNTCISAAIGTGTDLVIKDSSVDNCSVGGIAILGSGTGTVEITNTHVHYVNQGMQVTGGNVTVSGSSFSGLSQTNANPGILAEGNVMLDNCQISSFGYAIENIGGSVQMSRSTISSSGVALYTANGTTTSNGNNSFFNNSQNGSFTKTVALQ